ncbi:MAG TPA: sigma factor, partial [Longimicrobiaceae bacterium]|nr:sigma factor [Longimicrobiaceae bacterium]
MDRAAGGGAHLSGAAGAMEGTRVHGLVDHLFRREAGRMVSTLCRVFGPHNLELAEDVVQEALLRALREWPFRRVPDDPRAWLGRVARNRATSSAATRPLPARRRCSRRRR